MNSRNTIWIILLLLLLGALAFFFSPYRLGSFRDFRGVVLLRYWRVIEPEIRNPQILSSMLRSTFADDQTKAAFCIGLLPPHPLTSDVLHRFLDRRDVDPKTKDLAIWSIGVLQYKPALQNLRLRIDDPLYDQEILLTAIDRVEGRTEPGLFP